MLIFITGAAGFIGANLAKRVLTDEPGAHVVGLDNLNDYYDVRLKQARLAELEAFENFTFIRGDLADKRLISDLFARYRPKIVVNLAAQAGVRYSITNPDVYMESNIIGFYNILEACRQYPVDHLVYASSSSVYGANQKVPYATEDKVDTPVSLYAATKKTNELLAHAYAKLYDIPCTGLRFFTVYGPAGRPDMAYFSFTNKLRAGETIQIFNYGNCKRDFITSATANPRTCWISSGFCLKSWCAPGFCRRIMILPRIKSSSPCSPATFPSPTPTQPLWSATSASSPIRPYARVCEGLRSGTENFT